MIVVQLMLIRIRVTKCPMPTRPLHTHVQIPNFWMTPWVMKKFTVILPEIHRRRYFEMPLYLLLQNTHTTCKPMGQTLNTK